ncbi:GNAT family N-acetyltransferase [Pseudoxanthomonas suwonensis]|uniref:Phosphinothricin acetyltransferase n=1 Tax=Pseudoxanthomonas suwonensis TaxID=314722 RepID=A0A0E3Z5I4_9GAMM|nr:GNAT family N-acetyltransferase [Pseudoxanthomonas suwonensis]AKC88083.1 phosphinothricin acetyltransferase [Pseudoxanthomonas suwonensis]
MPLTVRDAAPADVPAITAIYAAEVRDHVNTYEYDVPDEAEMERRMGAALDAGYPYLVAEDEAGVAGYAYAGSYRTRIGYRLTVENSVYVAAGRQGRGIGAALLERLIADCEARGFRQMIAVIGEPANTASIRLHEKFGFRLVGIFRGIAWKHDRWLDTVQMQRELGAGSGEPPHDR